MFIFSRLTAAAQMTVTLIARSALSVLSGPDTVFSLPRDKRKHPKTKNLPLSPAQVGKVPGRPLQRLSLLEKSTAVPYVA